MPGDRARDVVYAALTDEPATTSDLYDRVGYVALMRAGLVPYPAFRETLVELAAEGRAAYATDDDGATVWRRKSGEGRCRSDQPDQAAVERGRGMREHGREAAERESAARPGEQPADEDPTKPAPPGSVPTTGQP